MNIYSFPLLAKTDHVHMITILTELAIKNVHMHVVLNEVCHLEVQIAVKLKAHASSKISYIIIINEKLNRAGANITESKLKPAVITNRQFFILQFNFFSMPKKANACVFLLLVKFHFRLNVISFDLIIIITYPGFKSNLS